MPLLHGVADLVGRDLAAEQLDGTTFTGFDYDVCKGCELCAVVCPTEAIEMVADDA